MEMNQGWARVCLAVLFLFVVEVVPAWGQNTTPEQEYKKLIHVSQDIQPLGANPFGENINLYNGSLSFEVTDVSEQGNGPVLQLARQYSIPGVENQQAIAQYAFGDWVLDLPRMETLADDGDVAYINNVAQKVNGWEVDVPDGASYDPNMRCSHFTVPLTVVAQGGASGQQPWLPGDWWKGYQLILPGEGSQDILANTDASTNATYTAVTKSHWRFRCLASTANGQPGEGFLAQAPDGTKYWFNELVYRYTRDMSRPLPNTMTSTAKPSTGPRGSLEKFIALLTGSSNAWALATTDAIHLEKAEMLVTQIQDRFGNTLTFNYDGNGYLTGITASDGRALAVHYFSGTTRIQSVTLQPSSGTPRTWTYAYTTTGIPSLAAVTLPDNSQWSYDFTAFDNQATLVPAPGSCTAPGQPPMDTWTGTVTHPSGLTGTFSVTPMEHGRSDVPGGPPQSWANCFGMQYADPNTAGSYVPVPIAWYSYTVTQKTLSGAGIPTAQTWTYGYSLPNDSWTNCGGSCTPANTTVWTDVVDPDGNTTRHTFSNRYDVSESKLQRVDFYHGSASSGVLLRSESYDYAAPGTMGLPVDANGHPLPAGELLQDNVNYDQLAQYAPQDERVIAQDGDTYTWQAELFNDYAQTLKERRFNSIAGQVADETQTTYYNDTNLWVLGLPLQTDNLSTGVTTNRYVYDTSDDMLTARYHFCSNLLSDSTVTDDNFSTCNRVMSYTWYTASSPDPAQDAGQLESFTDGNGHATSLSNYKRGIPQQIDYPDGTSESLAIDDLGQIASITDQASHTTSYRYDGVGRVTQIDYPSDSVNWAPKVFTYTYDTSTERGIGADHWRRTVSTGDAREVTWFDAELRPVLSESYDTTRSDSHTTSAKAYDWRGQTVFESYPASGSPNLTALTSGTHTTYDALGRETEVDQDSEQGTLTSSTAYLGGARKQVTDPNGNVTTTSYQVFDTPSYDAVTKVQAPESITQTVTRNIYGDPTSISQGDGSTSVTKTLVYDDYDRLCRTTEPESGSTVVDYDAAGNIAWSAAGLSITGTDCGRDQVASGSEVTRSYDAMNRVTAINYPDGLSIGYSYDALGNVHTATSTDSTTTATWTYAHDARNLLMSETLGIDGYSWPIGYSYDANASLQAVTYPDGKRIDYAPDALGRPTQAGNDATGVSYLADGSVEHFTYYNGTEYLAQKNARQLLSNLTYAKADNTLVYSQDMSYDANANLLNTTDLTPSGMRTKAFGYDALNRLTSATANGTGMWGTETYTYDALNNIRSMTDNGVMRSYTYDANNLLASIASGGTTLHSYTYDAQGNTTGRDGTTLVFDKANRLTQVTGQNSYAYDASGRRVKKTPNGGTPTYYAYSSDGQLMYQQDGASGPHTDYVYLGKQLVAEAQSDPGDATLNPPAVSFDANPNNGSYTVSWTGESGVASYELQESVDGGSWSTIYTGTAQNKAFSSKAGGTYGYRVRECQSYCGAWGVSAALGVTPEKPAITVPTALQSGAFEVSWSSPTSSTSYDVQEQINGGAWTSIASGTTQTSINRPAVADGTYAYQIKANNTYGTRGWATSGTVNVLHPPSTAPALSVPSGTNTTGSYTPSWSSVTGATSYTLQEQVDGGSWSAVFTGNATSEAISGKTNATYGYRVQACNASGCGPWSGTQSVTVFLPPPEPASITAPATSSGSLTVSWASASTATSYTLQHQVDGGSWSTIFTGNATSHAVAETSTGSYVYRVQACNSSGCSAYRTSSAVTVTIPPSSAPSLSAPGTSSTGNYTVSWGTVSGATSYSLQEQVNSGSWSASYSGSGTSKAYSGKTNGSTYGYRVQACNAGGCGPWSGTQSVQIAIPPAQPTNVHADDEVHSINLETVTVVWDAVSGATYYDVEDTSGSGGIVYSGSNTSAGVESGRAGTIPMDSYSVRACNAYACSAWVAASYSDTSSAVTTAPTLSGPTGNVTNGSYSMSWNAVAAASSFTLQEYSGGSWSTIYSGAATSMGFSGKANGTYDYRVQGCNSKGCGPWSTTYAVTVLYLPPEPASISVPGSSSGPISVSWASSSTATSYTLQQQIDGGSWSTVYSGGGTSYSATLLSSGSYVYRVQACNGSGCSAYRTSSTVTVTLPPDVPTLSVPSSNTTGSYSASWSSLGSGVTYTLQQQVNGGGWSTVYSGSGTSKAFSGMSNQTTYGYRVQGCNAGGCGAWSSTKSITVIEPPGNVIEREVVTGRVTKDVVSWDATPGATYYQIKLDGSSTIVYSGTATSYTAASATTPDVPPSHTVYVQECGNAGCSDWVTPTWTY